MPNTIGLFDGEQVVKSSYDDVLVLTSRRVRYNSVAWGNSNLISITLDSVASCGLVTRSIPILLVLAALAGLAAFTQQGQAFAVLLAAAIGLPIAYILTRKSVISIASNGGQAIQVPASSMKREEIVSFIDALERQKLA